MDSENNYLRVGFWNINGLSEEKSANDIHQIYINNFDLIFLLETWKSKTYINKFQHIVGSLHVNICGKTKNKKGRTSGSILVYYRKELSSFLSVFDKSHENITWFKYGIIKNAEVYIIARNTQVIQNVTNAILSILYVIHYASFLLTTSSS